MSCKILCRDDGRIAERISWLSLEGSRPEQTANSLKRKQPAQETAGESHKLHGRIAELERALEAEVRQAKDRAFQEGLKAGREAAAAEIQPVLERLLKACSDVAGLRAKIRRETESDIVTLAIAIARRVLRRELAVDPEAVQGIVKAALEKVQTKEICLVRTHPEFIAPVRAYFEKSGMAVATEISADPSLQPGGLVIETRRGNLDASVETQLKEIERGFTDRLGR